MDRIITFSEWIGITIRIALQKISNFVNWHQILKLNISYLIVLLCCQSETNAQSGLCTPNTPFYVVNLTGNPSGTWISPSFIRNGLCCGLISSDQCLEFQITLDPNSTGLIFSIASGAIPPGALFYQVNCGPMAPVGSGICLNTPGPHTITFCKPGNNLNTYSITSVPNPSIPQNFNASSACPATMTVTGLIPSSITWNDITSGSGIYNTYLSCTAGCSTTTVTPQTGHPAYAEYQVCGTPIINTCSTGNTFCDTVRVYFIDDANLSVTPNPASFCSYEGGITLTGSFTNGIPPYTYFWTNNVNGTGQVVDNDSIFYATTAGTYSFVVRDSRYPGCIQRTINVPVTINPAPILTVTPSNPSICQGSSVVLNANGANNLVWSPAVGLSVAVGNVVNANPTTSTTYTVTGTNVYGCTNASTVNLTVNPLPVTTFIAGDTICYGANNGFAWVNCSGGSFPYSYIWSNGNQTSVNSNLTAGNYIVTVTDFKGCKAITSGTIVQSAPLTSIISSYNTISCFGGYNGSATVSVTGGNPPYYYNWSNGGNTATQNNLAAGNYQVTVTDNRGCSSNASVILTQPSLLTASITSSTNVSCFGLNNGTASISAAGGALPYTYLWSNGANMPTINGLSAGIYTVTTTDNNQCSQTSTVVITQPTLLTSGVSQSNNISCYGGNNGSAAVTANGGISPYNYIWSNGANTISTSGLSAGTYYVTTTDNSGCSAVASIIITQPAVLTTTVSAVSNASCYNGSNGSAVAMTNGGTAPYNLNWSNGSSSNTIYGLSAGIYSVTVTDNHGCNAVASVNITQPALLSSSVSTTTNVSCFGGTNGSVTLIALGGAAPYTYNWSNGASTATNNNLPAGSYSVTITDNNGCTSYNNSVITQPTQLIINASVVSQVSCFGGNNGTAMVTANGGNAPYNYLWSNGSTNTNTGSLIAGNYIVTVADYNGCSVNASVSITQPPQISTVTAFTNATCVGLTDGTASVTVSGGTPGYIYNWSNGSISPLIGGLTAGNYVVTVTDNNGCKAYATVVVSETVPAIPTFTFSGTFCKGSPAPLLPGTSLNGVTGLWNPPVIDNMVSGVYVFTPNAGQCAINSTLHVTINPIPTVTAAAYPPTVCTGNSSVLSASGASSYTWEPGNLPGPTVNVVPSASTVYTVTGTSVHGCQGKSFVGVDLAPVIPVYFTSHPKQGCSPLPVAFDMVSTGLVDTNTLQWNFGDPMTTLDISHDKSPTYTYTDQGNFIVSLNALSIYGCQATGIDTITVYPNPDANFTTHPDMGEVENALISFYDQSIGATGWSWNFGDALSGNDNYSSQQFPIHYYNEAGVYNVLLIVNNAFNCFDTIVKSLKMLESFAFFVPNAFTPNGNERNEGFKGLGTGIDEDKFEMRIFDRWGKKIFETRDYNEFWDGKNQRKGIDCEQAIYVWQVNVSDVTGMQHNLIGSVMLIR